MTTHHEFPRYNLEPCQFVIGISRTLIPDQRMSGLARGQGYSPFPVRTKEEDVTGNSQAFQTSYRSIRLGEEAPKNGLPSELIRGAEEGRFGPGVGFLRAQEVLN